MDAMPCSTTALRAALQCQKLSGASGETMGGRITRAFVPSLSIKGVFFGCLLIKTELEQCPLQLVIGKGLIHQVDSG
jgi:hypothetical protein